MMIGKYRIKGLLGKGGMGRVYKVELPEIGKIAALKLLLPHEHMVSLLGAEEVERMFLSEARILGRLRHPNVASILDFDRDQHERPFFVMEYHCMNLGAMIGEHYEMEKPTRTMDPARSFRYCRQVLAGLDRLHHAGILHRDIKPYNVLITETDEARLIDFGLSHLRGETGTVPETFKVGTPYYAAPEQQSDPDSADPRADLYGAGVLMWRLLTGYLPPETGSRPRPGAVNSILGVCWDEFLLKSVSPDPEKRFAGSMEMMDALDDSHRQWSKNLEQACRLQPPRDARQNGAEKQDRRSLRKTPLKVAVKNARDVFGLDFQYRPAAVKTGRFEHAGSKLARDSVHGLLWNKSATRYPVDWHEAHRHIEFLNSFGFAGIRSWRLATVDELASLIRQASVLGDYCVSPLFDPGKQRLWSADRKSYTSAWFVDTELGYVGSADFTCLCHVRAVSDEAC
ncbi:MAG: protein kinase domain-containing protein [Desulfobacterales bacterium]